MKYERTEESEEEITNDKYRRFALYFILFFIVLRIVTEFVKL